MFLILASIYATVLIAATVAAILWGGLVERLSCAAIAVGWAVSIVTLHPNLGWARTQVGVLAADMGVLILLLACLAIQRPIWLMLAAGFQLAAVLVHVSFTLLPGWPPAYATALQACSWVC